MLSGQFYSHGTTSLLATASDRQENADISSPQKVAPACICNDTMMKMKCYLCNPYRMILNSMPLLNNINKSY